MLHADPTPRARRHRDQTERILHAALALVAEGGLDALSMHRLAAAVDLTPGALYRYHRSKEALIGALAAQVAIELATAQATVPLAAPPLRRVVLAVRRVRDLAVEAPHRASLLGLLLAHPRLLVPDPSDAAPALDAARAAIAPVVAALADAEAAGQLVPGDALRRAVLVFALVQGVLQLRKQQARLPELLDPVALLDEGLHALLAGWGASSEPLASAFAPGGGP